MRRRHCLTVASLGLVLGALGGCQTWVPTAGLTLPTGHYLEHPPQYIPPSPAYPLPRELATMEDINARAIRGARTSGSRPLTRCGPGHSGSCSCSPGSAGEARSVRVTCNRKNLFQNKGLFAPSLPRRGCTPQPRVAERTLGPGGLGRVYPERVVQASRSAWYNPFRVEPTESPGSQGALRDPGLGCATPSG